MRLTFPFKTEVIPEITSILVKVPIFPGTPPQTLGLINTKSSGTKNLLVPPSRSMASITPSGALFLTIETVARLKTFQSIVKIIFNGNIVLYNLTVLYYQNG
jgi:hypothetical protein